MFIVDFILYGDTNDSGDFVFQVEREGFYQETVSSDSAGSGHEEVVPYQGEPGVRHTHTHAYMHTHAHAHTHIHIRTQKHTHIHSNKHILYSEF